MILVANDVDAMAAARMLTQQLRTDNIAYTLRPVANFSQVIWNREQFLTDQISVIFMINCGATFNIPQLFKIEASSTFKVFVLDNHRPINLANASSAEYVTVFVEDEELSEELPDYDSDLEKSDEEYVYALCVNGMSSPH